MKAGANFCTNCGFSFGSSPEPQKQGSSFKEKMAKIGRWCKKHLFVVIPVAIVLVVAIILACTIPACIKAKDNGTYYRLKYDGTIDKETYFIIDSGEWKDEEGESGTYKKDGDKIIFYIEFFGSTEEAARGTIKDGVLIIGDEDDEDVFISSDHKHKYGDWKVTTEVTCTTDGEETRKCACGVKETKTVKCVGHHTGEWTVEKEATCIEKGLRTMTCTACKKDIEEDIDYAEHNLSGWLSNGSNHYKICSVCEKNFEAEKHDNDDCCTVCGYPFEFEFELSKGTYTVKSYKQNISTVIIPASFNGIPVTSIGKSAFSGCSGLTNITIPASVNFIGDKAFDGCSSLAKIKYIGDIAGWCGMSGLINLELGLVNLDLTKVYIGEQKLSEITNFVIPDGVTSIGNEVFFVCRKLTHITIPDSVTSIGEGAFYGSISLTSITFNGTKAQWYAIKKGSDWDGSTGNYTIHCTDGDIAKS